MSSVIDFSNLYWNDILNESFIPLVDDKSRYIICYGGRGSGKSDFAAKKLIFRCLNEKYFKCILIRNTFSTIKESQYNTIKSIIDEWGISEYFDFLVSPLEIRCSNGNSFLCRGCDDVQKLKSIRNPSAIWYEEEIPSYEDFNTITLSVRSNEADYLQEIFTINPEVDGNFEDNWFYKQFFSGHNTKSFIETKWVQTGNKEIPITYTTHHSTYKDNKWIGDDAKAKLESYKTEDPYRYTIHTLGEWGNKSTDGLFYRKFDRGINVDDVNYNKDLPLHISFDFNTNPYISISIWQIVNKMIYCVDEITTKDPFNNTRDACKLFKRRYANHITGLTVYGDPSGKNEDTRSEKGFNDYKIVEQELIDYRPTFRIASKHPPVKMRGDWINDIFKDRWDGLEILINPNCHMLITDLMNLRQKPDDTKLKEKDKNGYEKYGHLSDTMDYFMCECFKNEFSKYQRGPIVAEPLWFDHIPSPKHRL